MLWLLAGAAAVVAGATSVRTRSGSYSDLAAERGYPSITAALRSWLPGASTVRSAPAASLWAPHQAGSTFNLGNSTPPDTNSAAGDGPTHLYPGYSIGIGSDTGNSTGTMQWVPDSPGSNHGTIEWSDTPVVPPGSKYVTQTVRITRNGQQVPAQYTFNGRTFTGRIDANAGDVITFSQQGEAVAGNGSSTAVNVGGTVEPIRIPVAGQTDGGPGQWVPTNENMSHNSAYFQESVTHTLARGWSYKIGSTSYDGFYTDPSGQQRLLEAKGAYTNQMDVPWTSSTIKTIAGQMYAQAQGAKGTGATLDWYLQEPNTYSLFQQAQVDSGIGNIINWHTGSQGRPN